MSNVESITYEELLRECNLTESSELLRILRNRKGLPQISPRKNIPRKDAEAIVKAITGGHINWMVYKSIERDEKDDGPLAWSTAPDILNLASKWALEIDIQNSLAMSDFQLIALACNGGFLAGRSDSDFAINFDKGINVIIGDRGSGKSTVLSLLGAVSDSVGEETQILIERLLNVLNPEKTSNEKAHLNRRILKMLRHYGINDYGIFFSRQDNLYCYYINKKDRTYSYLKYTGKKWIFEDAQHIYPKIPLLFLSQGEVIRIAEDREQSSYFNNILDAIYPDLFKLRSNLVESAQNLLRQSQNFRTSTFSIKTRHVRNFIHSKFNELDKMQREISRGEFNPGNEKIISAYLDNCENYQFRHPEKSWETTSIINLLLENDSDVMYYLFVARIKKFLFKKLSIIKDIRKEHDDSLNEAQPQNFKTESDVSLGVEAEGEDGTLEEFLEEDDDEYSPPTLDDDLDEIDVKDESEILSEEVSKRDLETFLKYIEPTQRAWASRELLDTAAEVVEFLKKRLRVMTNWVKIYRYPREKYGDGLNSLAQGYVKLLKQKRELVIEQAEKCATITSTLNKDDLAINITTALVDQEISQIDSTLDSVISLPQHYSQIMTATPSTHLPDLKIIQFDYDATVKLLLGEIASLGNKLDQSKIDFFTFPIKVELLQGNIYRDFQQLSFGQKSGIILKMVLSTTNKSIIVIDQPEDNLDAYSIINIIAPALRNLQQQGRQIIVVTHNSNLVMETTPDRLIALESRGDSGRIKFLGKPIGKQAVREIFDILEGGVSTFAQKIKTYENFVGMAKKVEDWDIHLIESSFRQRTIDGLRNYLQPIVTDKSMLDFLRHQLKQWDPKVFRQQIREFINRLELMEENPEKGHDSLLDMLTELANELDYHIEQFTISIDEIRMMDTQPKRQAVNLYNLLIRKKEDGYIQQLRRSRRIQINIDKRLQEIEVIADKNHIDLVLKNLIENSLRATEKVVNRNRKNRGEYIETISFMLEEQDDKHVKILYSDNGCGVPEEILRHLYVDPCSTKDGKEGHGLGGIIIRKLLEMNNGSITVVDTSTAVPNSKLIQRILLTKVDPLEVQA